MPKTKLKPKPKIVEVHARLFTEDVETLKRLAEKAGYPWQIELRLLVRRALRGEKRELLVLTEEPKR